MKSLPIVDPSRVVVPLSRPYPMIYGAPVIDRVELSIFESRYFMACMSCTYCNDSCCQYGVDVDPTNVERLLAAADLLEPAARAPRSEWFSNEWEADADYPGGRVTRARVVDGACVFLSRTGRGCTIHSSLVAAGRDYHELKPPICVIFPTTFDKGLLRVPSDVRDRDLVCLDDGPTVYEGVRSELSYYFGEELVAELDAIELKSRG